MCMSVKYMYFGLHNSWTLRILLYVLDKMDCTVKIRLLCCWTISEAVKNFAICSWDNDICHARTHTHTHTHPHTHTHLYFITFLVYKAKLVHVSRCRKLPMQRTPRLRDNRDNTDLHFWNQRHIICRQGNKWTATLTNVQCTIFWKLHV